jgi:AraC-like DNA-binding protein
MNFNDYLNKYRLEMVTARLDAGENAQKTLEAIALECGFQSRVTFIRAFKKAYGVTPTEYLNQKKG